MTQTIRWGVLGTGYIARKFMEAAQAADGAEVVAIGSRASGTADAFADEFGIARRHSSYEAVAADPEIDAVYVSTPHPSHVHNTVLCLEAGKAVLCEKPFTVNAQEAERSVRTARAQHKFLMEAMWTRFLPALVQVRRWLAEGAIGEVRMVQASFGFRGEADPDSRLLSPEFAGGALLDVGIYPLSLTSMILGQPERIASMAHKGESGVDEQSAMLLGYPGGAMAVLASAVRTLTNHDAYILGTEGKIRIHAPFWTSQTVSLQLGEEEPQEIATPLRCNGFEYQIEEVGRCLREGLLESPVMPLDESLAIMRTMDEIRAQWGLRYPMEQ